MFAAYIEDFELDEGSELELAWEASNGSGVCLRERFYTASVKLLNWKDVLVVNAEGETVGTLGDVFSNAPANLDNAVFDSEGELKAWDGFFFSVDGGETVDWEIPENVNWQGLSLLLGR